MKPHRRNSLIWRWSLVSAGAIGLFWFVWFLIAGNVPVVSELQLTPEWTLAIPAIPRWGDVLICPIWAALFIRTFMDEKLKKTELVLGLGYGLGVGLVCRTTGQFKKSPFTNGDFLFSVIYKL